MNAPDLIAQRVAFVFVVLAEAAIAAAGRKLNQRESKIEILRNDQGVPAMDPQVEYVRHRFAMFVATAAALSAKSPPPGKNAANGFFREGMTHHEDIIKANTPATIELSGDALKLHNVYLTFVTKIAESFTPGNEEASWMTDAPVFWEGLGQIGDEISDVIMDFMAVLNGGTDEEKEAAEKDLADSLTKLVAAIENSSVVGQGRHANGYISVNCRNAANATLEELNASFPEGTQSDAGKVAAIIRVLSTHIAGLPVNGHKPWLRADWQVKFQAFCRTAEVCLSLIRNQAT